MTEQDPFVVTPQGVRREFEVSSVKFEARVRKERRAERNERRGEKTCSPAAPVWGVHF